MAPAVDDSLRLSACKCLNVRLKIVPKESVPPDPPNDPTFSKSYVGEDGIQVVCNISWPLVTRAHKDLLRRIRS